MSATIDLDGPVFTGEIHPYADRWPTRSADEIEAMADSIAVNGLRFPIILTPEGVLVDGRNRLRACEVAGITPRWEVREELDSEDAIVAFIWDANGDRRDMSKGAKAMLAALRPGTVRALSAQTNVADGYVNKARQVIEFCDLNIVNAVIADQMPLNQAYEMAQEIKATVQAEEIAERKRKAEQKAEAERRQRLLADLNDNRPDLAALVTDGKLTLDDALTIRRKEAEQERRAEQLAQEKRRKLNADFSVHVVTLAGLGEYPDRVHDLLADWDLTHQVVPVSTDLIHNAIRGLSAVAEHLQGDKQ